MNVAIYARYSSDNQSDTSIEQQLKVCREYCERYKLTVVDEYIDRAMSGRNDDRPQFQKMIKDSKHNIFQSILVYSVDRLSRKLHQATTYVHELNQHGVSIISATEPIDNSSTGIFVLNLLLSNAQLYSDGLGERVTRGMTHNVEQGFWNGGPVPFGYTTEVVGNTGKRQKKRLVVDEATAPIVRRIFEMYDNGNAIVEICQHLNEQGIKTSKGGKFNKNSLRTIFRSKRYIGIYTYADVEYAQEELRIVDDEIFTRVQSSLEMNKQAPAKNKATGERAYILTGKLFCGDCKSSMIGWSANNRHGTHYPYYICNGKLKKICNKSRVNQKRLEDVVIQKCRETLTDDNIEKIASEVIAFNEAEQRNNEYLKMLNKQITDNEKQRANLMRSLKSCEDEDLQREIMSEQIQMKEQAKELQLQLTIEESRKIKLTKREIIFFLKDLQNGVISDIKYRRTLINVLVSRIYLYENGRLTVILFCGDDTVSIDLSVIEDIEREINANCSNGYYLENNASPKKSL